MASYKRFETMQPDERTKLIADRKTVELVIARTVANLGNLADELPAASSREWRPVGLPISVDSPQGAAEVMSRAAASPAGDWVRFSVKVRHARGQIAYRQRDANDLLAQVQFSD